MAVPCPRVPSRRITPIIAWPITHAVLPVYLQRNLARLLFDFRTGLTAQLLQDPDALGARLASRTGPYTERFRLFCQNTALLGKISVALLSGEDDESPYLLRQTLRRLVDGLSKERDSRQWLEAARRSAAQLRTRTRGFVRDQQPSPRPPQPGRPAQPDRPASHSPPPGGRMAGVRGASRPQFAGHAPAASGRRPAQPPR